MQRPIQLAQLLILLLTSSVKSDDVLQISITGKNTFGGEIFENVLKQSQINIIDNDSLDVVKSYDDLISLYSDGVVEIHIPSNLLENRHIAWSPIEDKAIFIEKDAYGIYRLIEPTPSNVDIELKLKDQNSLYWEAKKEILKNLSRLERGIDIDPIVMKLDRINYFLDKLASSTVTINSTNGLSPTVCKFNFNKEVFDAFLQEINSSSTLKNRLQNNDQELVDLYTNIKTAFFSAAQYLAENHIQSTNDVTINNFAYRTTHILSAEVEFLRKMLGYKNAWPATDQDSNFLMIKKNSTNSAAFIDWASEQIDSSLQLSLGSIPKFLELSTLNSAQSQQATDEYKTLDSNNPSLITLNKYENFLSSQKKLLKPQ